jgi:hypothetical protein
MARIFDDPEIVVARNRKQTGLVAGLPRKMNIEYGVCAPVWAP